MDGLDLGSFQRSLCLPGGSGVGRQAAPLAALRRQATCLNEKPSPAPKAFFLRCLYAFTAKRLLSMPLMLLASPRGISKWRKVGRHMTEKRLSCCQRSRCASKPAMQTSFRASGKCNRQMPCRGAFRGTRQIAAGGSCLQWPARRYTQVPQVPRPDPLKTTEPPSLWYINPVDSFLTA